MVTGFNSEVQCNEVVYHVQTEPRKGRGIETTVYCKGAVVHSVRTPCPEPEPAAQDTDQQFQRCLEDQHRQVVAQIRAGKIPSLSPATSSV